MARTERCSTFSRGRTCDADAIAITKLDVLDDLEEIPVCVAYHLDGRPMDSLPPLVEDVARLEPVYETLPGWKSKTTAVTRYDDLPPAAVRYVRFLEDAAGAPAAFIATGPRREETIRRPGSDFLAALPPPSPESSPSPGGRGQG